MKYIFAAAILMAMPVTSAYAGATSGNAIIKGCEGLASGKIGHLNEVTNNEAFQCFGAISGVEQIMLAHKDFCPSTNISGELAVKMVVQYMHDHPKELGEDYGYLIFTALREKWPCKNS